MSELRQAGGEPTMMLINDDSLCSESATGLQNHGDTEDTSEQPAEAPKNTIGKKESQEVYKFKIIVLIILFLSAIVTSTCVYVFITRKEEDDFHEAFQKSAAKVLDAVGNSIDQTLIVMDTLAVESVSYARASNSPWPFVTLPDFGIRMSKSIPQTDAALLTLVPFVQPWQKTEWEQYADQNKYWLNETMKLQETWDGFYAPILYNYTTPDVIYTDWGDLENNVSRIIAPSWQCFPLPVERGYLYNWDWLSQLYTEAHYGCIKNHKVYRSPPYMIPRPDDLKGQAEAEGWRDYFGQFLEPGINPFQPIMDVIYPIVDDLSQVGLLSSEDYDPSNHTIVGFVTCSIYWREIITNVLSPGSNGVIIVVDSDCRDSFTYQIDGPEVTYLGVLDHHDTSYDDFVISTKVVDLHQYSFQQNVYTGAPQDTEFCQYSLRLYPSDDLKSEYTTNNALTFMLVTLVSFALLAIIFVTYDFKVERRQKKVLSSAVRSSEIVSSLFPTSVQDQLYPTVAENDKRSVPFWSSNEKHPEPTAKEIVEGPIAKLYPDTTVMFADIKGFTQWSASREPTDVFYLLETLYGGFDRNAKIYGVFKVETIGDTYVAVVGLPTARKHHAVVMAKFAKKCLNTMAEIIKEMETALGPDTADLSLRIGLNSGPTTAGVLRGEKARFQLFGDTVNTASRMESTGESGKIQVSENTAALISLAGKGHWITKRSEEVMAKGKGIMQTFWCDPSSPNFHSDGSAPSASMASSETSSENEFEA